MSPGLEALPSTFGSFQDDFSSSQGKVVGQVLARLLLLVLLEDGLPGGHLVVVLHAVLHLHVSHSWLL